MALPTTLQVGLKEWAVVCRALEHGRQTVLLRKGGIYEAAGEFEVEHRAFLLFPTYLHQNLKMLKPAAHPGFEPRNAEPEQVAITAAGVVTDIIELKSRAQVETIDDEHVWTEPLIDMRFSYRPQNPLYLLLVRAYRLQQPTMLANTPAYAGCKSWVPLDQPIGLGDATPVLDDTTFALRRTSILDRIAMI
ncbi:MAG: DUF1802 family protein [Tepidisphaeraceae bacterium]